MFRRLGQDETILTKDETIFRFWRITCETAHGYQLHNDDGTPPATKSGHKIMRALSFILAFGFVARRLLVRGLAGRQSARCWHLPVQRFTADDHGTSADHGRHALLIANKKSSRQSPS